MSCEPYACEHCGATPGFYHAQDCKRPRPKQVEMSSPWGEAVLLERIAALTARAEGAEKRLERAQNERGFRDRKRKNRRAELRRLHKAIARYRAGCACCAGERAP